VLHHVTCDGSNRTRNILPLCVLSRRPMLLPAWSYSALLHFPAKNSAKSNLTTCTASRQHKGFYYTARQSTTFSRSNASQGIVPSFNLNKKSNFRTFRVKTDGVSSSNPSQSIVTFIPTRSQPQPQRTHHWVKDQVLLEHNLEWQHYAN
jgi:hypothetical protein